MKKFYEEPEYEIRNYLLNQRDIIMTSDDDPDLGDGPDYNYFG